MRKKVDWDKIDTVLLDMDGTLIDQHHEDVFWDVFLPRAYAKKHGITQKEALKKLYEMYRAKEGHADWGNVEAWGRDLDMDLTRLRKKIKPYIKLHPHTLRFLKFLKKRGKDVYIVTGASPKDIGVEVAHTKLDKYVDKIYSQVEIGKSKRDISFWKDLRKKLKFDEKRTLLAEDNEAMAKAAANFGIKWIVFKSKYSSRKPPRYAKKFICVHHFNDII